MKGSTFKYQTKAGERWAYSVRIKGRNQVRRGFATKKAADSALRDLLSRVAEGQMITPARLTLSAWADRWLASIGRDVEPRTLEIYRRVLRLYILPALGEKRLDWLEPIHFERLYADLETRGLSRSTIRLAHAVARGCLNAAVERNQLHRNPVMFAKPGKTKPYKPQVWSASELGVFLDAVRGGRLEALWTVYATTGMRRGEALALRWNDFDPGRRLVHVSAAYVMVNGHAALKATKTDRPRTIDLDDRTVTVLQDHAGMQADELAIFGAGPTAQRLIFCREDGSPLRPDTVTREFARIVDNVGLTRIRLHDLRHTHATLLLKAGVPVKVVSERLGHASPVITMNTYAHVLPGMQADAAALFSAILQNNFTSR